MWKCVPRNIRETVERRVTRKISRSEKPPCQEIKQTSALQTKLISPATQQVTNIPSPDSNGKRLTEIGKCSWESQHIAKFGKPFRRDSTETCRILSAIIPCLTQQFNSLSSKGFNVWCENKKKKCGSRKQQKEKQQESTWENGSHIEHTWLGALGWSTALVLGWYMIQPLCRFWVFPYDKKRKCPKRRKFLLNVGRRDKRHDARYISLVEALSRTALAQPLSVVSQQQAENSTLLDEPDDISAIDQVTNVLSEVSESEQIDVSAVTYGPPTAEEALDEAATNFFKVHNTAVGDIDNSLGVSLMHQGKHKEALSFFTRGMEYNNPAATYNLAVCYEKGLGISQDLKKAAKFYKMASEKGHATAMYNLGVFHVHGWGGLPVDLNQAHELFEKASSLGQDDAKKALDMVTPDVQVRQVENNTCEESTNALLHALGLVQNTLINENCNRKELQEQNLYTSLTHEESSDFVTLSNGSQLDVKNLTQLIENTILKYKVCN
ncbi:DAP3-binding cell death enhancer 1 [Anabrus simplex]|uniref:DAP3-binding cell death enhancer 1 n=1 Tax=Anabrus simplex TaxID=316456 RepID=UPI0034DCD507